MPICENSISYKCPFLGGLVSEVLNARALSGSGHQMAVFQNIVLLEGRCERADEGLKEAWMTEGWQI